MTYRIIHETSVSYKKEAGYKATIPRWYAMLLELKNKDRIKWGTDGKRLIIEKA